MSQDNLQKSLQPKSQADPLDTLLSQKIGYGNAQQKLSRTIYLLLFSQGCQTIVLGLILPTLAKQWTLSIYQQSLLITVVYIGVAIGSYLQGFSDKYGRYTFILWDTILQTIFGLLSCISWSFQSFLIARFFYGIGIGICLPLSATYVAQICPKYMRIPLLYKTRVFWSLGSIFTCFLGWFLLQQEHWRLVLFIICLPGAYAYLDLKANGRQTLRYLWVQKRTSQVKELVDFMCQHNQRPPIGKNQITALMEQSASTTQKEDIPLSGIFNEKYKPSTLRLLFLWFTACFIYYGIMLLLPTILQRVFQKSTRNKGIKYIFLVVLSIIEVIAAYLGLALMQNPKIGRKWSLFYGSVLLFAASVALLFVGQDMKFALFIVFSIVKLTSSPVFIILYPYTVQIYETMLRSKALGICSFSGRIATIFLGIVGVSAIGWLDGNGLYTIFIFLSGISSILAFTMPYCTLNRPIH